LRYASKVEIQTNSYKNSVKSDDFTEFLVRPTRFTPSGHKLRTVLGNKNTHPGGVGIFMVRPTRFERATYRVGVFRRILIKCCVFKGLRVFTGFAANYRTFSNALKTLGKTVFLELWVVVVK
jgi:hypothetical protein